MLAILLAAGLAAAPQAAEPSPPALTNAEACLRDKVADAVAASTSASDAADFLLTYLCAGPVERAATWQRNTRMLAAVRVMFDDMKEVQTELAPAFSQQDDDEAPAIDHAAITNRLFDGLDGVAVDPVTGDLVIPDGADGIGASMLRTQTRGTDYLLGDQRPVFLRELAGQLVLEARTRR